MTANFSKLGKLSHGEAQYDTVIVGAGHNGLTTAAYLAAAGQKVLVLERNGYPGGGVSTMELTEPGFWSERHGAIHCMILINPLLANDELGLKSKYGLEYIPLDVPYALVAEDLVCPIYQDRQRTLDHLKKIAPEDVEAFDRFMTTAVHLTDLAVPTWFEPPADSGDMLAKHPDGQMLAEYAQLSTMEVLRKYFKSDVVIVTLARLVSETQLAHPNDKATGLLSFLLPGILERKGQAIPRGGGNTLNKALIKSIEDNGGEIRLNTEITRIEVENGKAVGVRTRAGIIKARKSVVASIHPWLLDRLVPGLDTAIVSAAKKTKTAPYTAMGLHASLERPIHFKAGPIADMALMNTIAPASIKDMMDSYAALDEGKFPDKALFGGSVVNYIDPSRCPDGKALLHISAMTVWDLADGGYEKWEEVKDEYAQELLRDLSQYYTDLTPDNIRSYFVLTPVDHVHDTPSMQFGDICALASTADQFGTNRPTAALSNYRVPGAQGLYLVGPFMHPGGGITGGGRPVAKAVLADQGVDFDELFVKKESRQLKL